MKKGNTIFRRASTTKLITSGAIMTLYEEGRFRLSEPALKYIPAFEDVRVLADSAGGAASSEVPATVPAERPITIVPFSLTLQDWGSSGIQSEERAMQKGLRLTGERSYSTICFPPR